MFGYPTGYVGGYTGVEAFIFAAEDIDMPHGVKFWFGLVQFGPSAPTVPQDQREKAPRANTRRGFFNLAPLS